MRRTALLIAAMFGLMWGGCNVINPSEPVPTYVHIDSIGFNAKAYNQYGTASHKISSVWVYFNNEAVGVFQPPVNVPIIMDKPGLVTVAPGIDMNGLSGMRVPYPFYSFDSLNLSPNPGKIVNFPAKTTYAPAAKMYWSEDFNNGNSFVKFYGDTSIMRTTDGGNTFEGAGSGYIVLNGANSSSENVAANGPSFKTTTGNQVYIELDYKCSVPFQVGLESELATGDVYKEYVSGLKAHPDTWNKVYLNVTDIINGHQGLGYRVIVRAGLDDGTTTSGWVLLDNLKVISF